MYLVFVASSDEVLLKRYQETRRNHPLAQACNLSDAIAREREIMQPILETADFVITTDQLNIHQLRLLVRTTFQDSSDNKITVSLISFGFKYGLPPESSLLFDIRFLPNPHFIPDLKPLSGLDDQIQKYLFTQQTVSDYWLRMKEFIIYSLEQCKHEGRFFINIAIGCTGGRHRSVAFVQKLAQEQVDGVHFIIKHRDINRESVI
jgi:UPF0042 nucleotide-binding protein